jgi:hypothetical protein
MRLEFHWSRKQVGGANRELTRNMFRARNIYGKEQYSTYRSSSVFGHLLHLRIHIMDHISVYTEFSKH